MQLINRVFAQATRLRDNLSGVAMLEFAMSLPVILGVGAYGLEVANLALVQMRVSQVALAVADNASRAGETSTLAVKMIDEADVNEIFIGAGLQTGGIDILENGRIVLSSLEQNAEGGQWIHWQRCKGAKDYPSLYGDQGEGSAGTGFDGMGPKSELVTAPPGGAVMYVEVTYEFEPMISEHFASSRLVRHTAAFLVRENRDLTRIYNNGGAATPISSCDKFNV